MTERPYEKRTVTAAIELRDDADAPVLEGYASTFDEPYPVGHFTERIHRDAFKRTLSGQPDVRLLIDHEGQPLARTKSGTLTLTTDDRGLAVRAELDPSDPDVQRLLPKMRRGDLDQMSFAFRVPTGGDEWDYSGPTPKRTIREAVLHGGDVSVVTYPANEGTTASVRANDEREAAFTLADAMLQEIRSGRPLSATSIAAFSNAMDVLDADLRKTRHEQHLEKITDGLADRLSTELSNMKLIGHLDPADMRAQMTAASIDNLPDSDFAYIEPGGKKDDEGKTVPRSLRHFPIQDADHVRNALSRAPQSPFGEKAMPKILAAAKKFGIDVAEHNSTTPLDLALRIAEGLQLHR